MLPEKNIPAIDFLPLEKDPYRVRIGQGVEIATQQANHVGIYRGMDFNGSLILQPHVALNVTSNGKRQIRWETESPAFISGDKAHVFPQDLREIIAECSRNSGIEPEYFI